VGEGGILLRSGGQKASKVPVNQRVMKRSAPFNGLKCRNSGEMIDDMDPKSLENFLPSSGWTQTGNVAKGIHLRRASFTGKREPRKRCKGSSEGGKRNTRGRGNIDKNGHALKGISSPNNWAGKKGKGKYNT